jgi:hypothetical protein
MSRLRPSTAAAVFVASSVFSTAVVAQSQPPAEAPVTAAIPQQVPARPAPPAGQLPPGAEALPSPSDLMARIHLLEKRLADVEDKKRGAAKPKSAPHQAAKEPNGGRAVSTPSAGAPVAHKEQDIPPASGATPSAPTPGESDAPVTTVAKTAAGSAPPSDSSLQASFLFRETAPTLATNKSEISFDGTYVRSVRAGGTPFTQFDRLFVGAVEAKFGVGQGFEIGAAASYFASARQTRGAVQVDEDVQGLGDLRFNVAKQLWAPSARLPGMALSVGVDTPTGSTRYGDVNRVVALQDAAQEIENERARKVAEETGQPPQPREMRASSKFSPFLPSFASRGHWGVSANAQFFKTFDPVVIFFGIGANYAFAREFEGNTYQPGLRLTYNAGLSLALSEHTTLGFQYSGTVDQRFKYTIRTHNDGRVRQYTDPSQETARARVVVIQRLDDGLFMEPSLTMGLTDDTPDLTVGLAVRKRM